MRREVEINIPMFIGIIILVAVITAALVYVVNIAREAIGADNERMDEGFEQIDEYFGVTANSAKIDNIDKYNENVRLGNT